MMFRPVEVHPPHPVYGAALPHRTITVVCVPFYAYAGLGGVVRADPDSGAEFRKVVWEDGCERGFQGSAPGISGLPIRPSLEEAARDAVEALSGLAPEV